jgi:outer membrane protein assembly factor BamE (lipoprotein component of BamABCDE complex)
MLAFALSVGCAHISTEATENARKLKFGLTKEEVKGVMGEPLKTEGYLAGEAEIENWYYTSGFGYWGPSGSNFYVLEFENDKLVAWGKRY